MARPTHCVDCGYSLRGSPDEGHCPECNMPYDPTMVVVEEARGQIIAYVVLGLISAVVAVAPFLVGSTLKGAGWCVPMTAVVSLYAAWRYWKGHRNRAVVLRTGIGLVFRADEPTLFFGWDEIGAVDLKRNWKTHIVSPSGKRLHTLDLDFFGSRDRACRFAENAQRRLMAVKANR